MSQIEEAPFRQSAPAIEVPEAVELDMTPEEFAVENEADESRFRSESDAARAMLDRFKSQFAIAEENLARADDGTESMLYDRLKETGLSEEDKTVVLAEIVAIQKELDPLRQAYESKRQLFDRSRAAFETKYGPYERTIQ
jgi:uncharacterized protein YhaN